MTYKGNEVSWGNLSPSLQEKLNNSDTEIKTSLDNHIKDINGHLQTGERVKWNLKRDFIAVDKASEGSYPDPNTFLDATFITNHANAQSNGSNGAFWYIEQVFYGGNGLTNARSQFARSYIGTNADVKVRHFHDSTWSAWSPSLQQVFQSVSSGKTLVANATTDMGVTTSPTAEFATMAANIRTIPKGVPYAAGFLLSSSIADNFEYIQGSTTVALFYIDVTHLSFTPKYIYLSTGVSTYVHTTMYRQSWDALGPESSKTFTHNANAYQSIQYNLKTIKVPNGLRIPVLAKSTTYEWFAWG